MDKSELDILLRQLRLEERIIGDKENRNMDGSTVSFQSLRLSGQPSNLLMISPHGRFRPTPMHTHDYLEVMYLYDGSITQHWKGGSAVLSHGDFFFVPPGIYHATDVCGAGDIAVNLIVSDELLKKEAFSILRENLSPNEPYLIRTGHRRANETVCRLMEEIFDPENYAAEAIEQTAILLAIDLARVSVQPNKRNPAPEELSQQDILYRVIRYIESGYKTVTLSETADTFGYTPNHLSVLLKKELGQSFSDFRHSFCMAQAALLLRESELPITEVAAQSGFSNMTHFYKLFDRKFHMTPGEYRILSSSRASEE